MEENRIDRINNERDKTEEMLNYALLHLQEAPPISEIAKRYGFSEKYVMNVFVEVYGVSYGRLVKMFRMREVARKLRYEGLSAKKTAQKCGFKDYSNFKRSFKRELGVTPREFVSDNVDIPDMPLPKTINGHKLSFKYEHIEQYMVYGWPIRMKDGTATNILHNCSYVLEHPCDSFDINDVREQIGFWWSETENDMYFVHGFKENELEEIPEGTKVFDFPAYDYAVFSVERGKTTEDVLKTQRMLVNYAMTVWREINHKVSTWMVYTYETFDSESTCVYLPIVGDRPDSAEDRKSVGKWIAYINEHITEDMSLRSIAEYFNYSEQHFHRVFKKYIKMSPSEYIIKCRLYLAAKRIREEAGNDTEHIARHFRFKTMRTFRKQFLEEFHVEPEAYHNIPINMVNLTEYYPEEQPEVRITFYTEDALWMLGKTLYTKDTKEIVKEPDIPHLNAYWMQHEYDELKGTVYECTKVGAEDKISLWDIENNLERSFILGPVVDDPADIPENYTVFHFLAGKYAIFESLQESDRENPAEVYSILMRNGLDSWSRKNEFRIESGRKTFVRYKNEKMYLYIPVNE